MNCSQFKTRIIHRNIYQFIPIKKIPQSKQNEEESLAKEFVLAGFLIPPINPKLGVFNGVESNNNTLINVLL